jgi:ATP-dependent DNA helicase RecG
MCRELEVNGSTVPVFHTDDFILKVTVAKVTEKLPENAKKLPENNGKLTEKLPENYQGIIDRIIKKANSNGEKLKENKIAILRLIAEDPYISKTDIANTLGISYTAVESNIKAMRGKYLRRVGPDKGGFWEIIE